MPLIHAYFYSPSDGDHRINHLVSWWDAPYAHCDIQFEDGMASSVFQGEEVYWRKRGFKKPGYSRVTLPVLQANYDKAYRLCQERHAKRVAFDAVGLYAMPFSSLFSVDRGTHTFCSKHCTEVLQVAGVRAVADLSPGSMTPSGLRRALNSASVLHTDRIDLRIARPSRTGTAPQCSARSTL
jgi:hypothetical protein